MCVVYVNSCVGHGLVELREGGDFHEVKRQATQSTDLHFHLPFWMEKNFYLHPKRGCQTCP